MTQERAEKAKRPARVSKFHCSKFIDLVLVMDADGQRVTTIKVGRIVSDRREASVCPLLGKAYLGGTGREVSLLRVIADIKALVAAKTGSSNWRFATSTGGKHSPVVAGPLAEKLAA
ncbi:hypothetical protein [Nibricoccus aquaticus]|uniref:hypothetical protein n=1 Tax=Nibricoccus aquaticus TaxID=2576891 RepID=UPI0010FD9F4F|nr:hypothetical protein [Nibricoccus aquaticus]